MVNSSVPIKYEHGEESRVTCDQAIQKQESRARNAFLVVVVSFLVLVACSVITM